MHQMDLNDVSLVDSVDWMQLKTLAKPKVCRLLGGMISEALMLTFYGG